MTAAAACVAALLVVPALVGCGGETANPTSGRVEAVETTTAPGPGGDEVNEGARKLHVTSLTETDIEDYTAGEWYDAVAGAMSGYGGWDPSVPWYYSFDEDGNMRVEYRKEHGQGGPMKALSLSWDAGTGKATVDEPPHPVQE